MKGLLGVGIAITIAAAAPANKPVDLTLTDSAGNRAHLRDYRGKPVVLNFWATWCGPCKEELPLLTAAEKEYRARGVVFIAASLDDAMSRARVPEFVKQHAVEFPVWTGAAAEDLDRLHMGEAVPATAFIDEEGRVVARISGEFRQEELRERIEWLLSDRSGTAPKAFVSHVQ